MSYLDILLDGEDDSEDDEEEGCSFTPSTSSKNEAILTRLDNLAAARKAASLVKLLRSMLERGTLRIDSAMLPTFLVDAVKRQHAQEKNAKAFALWLDTLCIILADNAQEWLELNTLAIECRTFSTLGSAESGKAYQLARKKRAYYIKALQREQQSNARADALHADALQQSVEQRFDTLQSLTPYGSAATLTPYGVWFAMCEALLHSALDARFFESLTQAEIISERAYKGSKCKYHLDLSGQAKSDYKRVIHNTGANAGAFDHLPTDTPLPARQPPRIIRKLSKLR